MPNAAQRSRPKALSSLREEWWSEPQDLSRFAGLTQNEIHRRLYSEWKELTKDMVF